jgi:hypothetical protein
VRRSARARAAAAAGVLLRQRLAKCLAQSPSTMIRAHAGLAGLDDWVQTTERSTRCQCVPGSNAQDNTGHSVLALRDGDCARQPERRQRVAKVRDVASQGTLDQVHADGSCSHGGGQYPAIARGTY